MSLDDWSLPDNRVKSLVELHALRGKPIYIVTQKLVWQYDAPSLRLPNVHVQMCFAGPILLDYSKTDSRMITQNRYDLYDPATALREGDVAPQYYLTENGDWGNTKRIDLTVFPLAEFLLDEITPPETNNNAIFRDRDAAEVWAVQVKLTSDATETTQVKFRGLKQSKRRRQVKSSLRV